MASDRREEPIVRPLSEVLAEAEKLIPTPFTQHQQRLTVIVKELIIHLVILRDKLEALTNRPVLRQDNDALSNRMMEEERKHG